MNVFEKCLSGFGSKDGILKFLKFSVQEFILAVGLRVGSEGGKVNDESIVGECLKSSDQSRY